MSKQNPLLKAQTQLLFHHPFFATLVMKLKKEECYAIPTMDVDGITLRYNPDFVTTCWHTKDYIVHYVIPHDKAIEIIINITKLVTMPLTSSYVMQN